MTGLSLRRRSSRQRSSRPRSSWGFAIFTLVMVVAFAGLGIWQLQRRVEKHVLIAALTERLAAAPDALPCIFAMERADAGQGRIPPRQLYRDLRTDAGCDGL